MIRYAIDIHGIRRIELRVSPDNPRARAIAVRLSMTHEATLRSDFGLNGTRYDSEVWSIVAEHAVTAPDSQDPGTTWNEQP